MKTLSFVVALGLALPTFADAPDGGVVTPPTVQPHEAKALSRAFAATAKAVRPSVVRIDVEEARGGGRRAQQQSELPEFFERFFGDPERRDLPLRGTGSGVVFDTAGHIVTNRHVVANADKMTVTLVDGRELTAKVVGKDSRTDVAVLKLDQPPKDLVAARLGNSDACEVGEWMLAVGSPLGMEQTVTAGILSGKGRARGRVQMSGDRVRSYLQTDAKINPGNSGGPLVDLNGEVIGINTLINAGPGGSYGFAIPINEVREVASQLIKSGKVAYAYLGVMVGDLDALGPEQREKLGKGTPAKGGLVSDVSRDSPAEKAGIKPGDVITSVDRQPVEVGADVVDSVSARPIGSKVAVQLIREGKPKTVQVTLGELPADDEELAAGGGPENLERFGMWVQTLTPELAAALGLEPGTQGAVVSEVVRGSPAARGGIQQGDVISEVDRKPVNGSAELRRALEQPKRGGFLLRVKTARGSRFITLKDR
ncbi:MAG: trypsin-like peptidase domain-containing protein [Archangium sp.]|nr:trypsin-like peptidase domain-containing protein [Archangium sp.]MDP3572947.1 trypsin-like peptidase domain-containing protein [Archangium sp.]